MVPQPITRPLFLEQDERRVHGVGMVGDQASYLFPYMPQPGPSEHAELRRELERIMEENQKLRARIETLESMRVDDDQKFSTPEEPKKEAVDPHSKEAAGSRAKEAVDPHSKEVAGSPSKEAVDPHSKEVAGSPSKEAADPHFKEAVRPPKTEAQDPRSFKAEEAVRPPKHEAEDSRSSQPKEAADPQSQRPKDDGSGANTTFTERSLEFMALMMDSMKEMHKRLNEPKDEGVIKGVETVRSGAPDLPLLAPWEPQQGPLILGDWLLIIEPIISDLSTSASVWWKTSVSAAEAWYKVHMALSPLDRIQHKVETPEEVLQQKWERLERRVATMLLQALPQEVRGELVAARRLTTFGVITHLLVTYSPGGISEKQNLLRNLEDPPEIQTVQDGPAALRRWLRWRHRAKDIGAVAPDPSLQLRGLLKMSKKTLEAHRELQFRVSLVRSGLQVDTVPNDTNVEQFAYHLLAEYEQLSISEKRPGGNATTSKQDATKAKQNEVEKPKAAKLRKLEEDARSPTKRSEEGETRGKCKFYLSDQGCRRGKACQWSHDQKDEKRRCWNCGSPEHMSPVCPRPKKEESPHRRSQRFRRLRGRTLRKELKVERR